MAIDVLPLGKLMRAASMINAFDEDQATSLEFSILNFHVNRSLPCGLEFGSLISSAERIITVSSLDAACSNRLS